MAFTYSPSTDRGKVRLLISDTDDSDATRQLFTDEEIDTFLTLRASSVFRAAATALRTIASNEVQVQKRISILDLRTDGPSEARALRQLADDYEQAADEEDREAVSGGFAIAEFADDEFGRLERLRKEAERET